MSKERIVILTLEVVLRDLSSDERADEEDDDLPGIDDVLPDEVGDAFGAMEENSEAFAGTGLGISISKVTCVSADWKP